jgi:hypothetical protein
MASRARSPQVVDPLAAALDTLQVAPTRPLKVLLYDIETSPMAAYIWHPTDQYVPMDRLIHDKYLLTWSAKWWGESKVHSGVIDPDEARDRDDSRIVAELGELIRQADFVVAHNGDRFDVPVLNARLLQLGLDPLGNPRQIDTLKLAKKNLKVAYNKLDYLGEYLGVGRKIDTDFQLWLDCMAGVPAAIKKMAKYNRQDVLLLEKVFDALLPYVKNLPRLVEATEIGQSGCPSCGSKDLHRAGYHRTNASTFFRWQCQTCRRYCRGRKSSSTRLALVPV